MKNITHDRLNVEIILKLLLLLGFSACFIVTYTTGNIRNYLNPRLFPYVFFAGLAFFLMAMSLIFGHFTHEEHKFNPIPYLLFLIPLVLAFALPAQAITSNSTQLTNMQIAGLPAKANPNLVKNDWGSFDMSGGKIAVNDKNYMACYEELYDHPEKFKGRSIACIGYVDKSESGLQSNSFIVGRDMMWCCAADLQFVGYLCSYDKLGSIPEKSWIKVVGKLDVTTYLGKSTPIIINPVITPTAKPAVEYIYPFQ
jgi:putative membrane protein